MADTVWQQCTTILEGELSAIQFNTWIKPLHADEDPERKKLRLLAPNRYIRDQVSEHFLSRIESLVEDFVVSLAIGTFSEAGGGPSGRRAPESFSPLLELHKEFTFDTFVKGSSNELARAAALHVAENMGAATYKCLLLYGGVGLGKTHLMHAVGNAILDRHPGINVAYMYSQRFMEDMVSAIERGAMNEFTEYYRKVDVLLMDDIQFLAKGPKSQEEFFHVFNRLQENGSMIVLTCDRYPKEIEGLEERLQSRFVWGMTAPLDPPELETRVAIVKKKAEMERVELPNEAAFFIAEHIRANVRELEGALQRVVANANFTGREITLDQVKSAIKDLVAIADRQVGIENIKRTVADYYNIRVSDMHSPKRSRSLARPRQVAMALSKELTSHSLPEIGQNFGGRDHTTVLHACRRIDELRESNRTIGEDYNNLMRTLTA